MELIRNMSSRMRGRTAARLCVLAGFLGCAGLSSSATIGTSSWLQVNLSFMPFSYYDNAHLASSNGFTAACPPSNPPTYVYVQGCFQQVLRNMAAQNVSGVRIIVTLCDNSSLAFNNLASLTRRFRGIQAPTATSRRG